MISSPGKETARPAGKRALSLTMLLLLGVVALFAAKKLSDPDIWWHLAEGRRIWGGELPSTNGYAHTHPDHPWDYPYRPFGLLLWASYLLGGYGAVEAVQIFFVLCSFALCLEVARRRRGLSLPASLPFVLLALAAAHYRFAARPHLANFMGISLLIFLWEVKPRTLPLWLFAAGLVWSNSHGGVVYGLAVLAAAIASSLVSRAGPHLKKALIGTAAFFAGSLVNPKGFLVYGYAFWHLDVERFLPVASYRHAHPAMDTAFFVFAFFALAAALLELRRREIFTPLLFAAFFPLSLYAVRAIPNFVFATLPGLLAVANGLWRGGGSPSARRTVLRSAAAAACLIVAAATVLLPAERFEAARASFGWGIDEEVVPEGAVRTVRSLGLRGNMFNEYGQGGYLIWRLFPEHRVFIDGRAPAYPTEFLQETLRSMHREGWRSLMDRYGIEFAVVMRRPTGSRIDLSPLFRQIGWPMIQMDGISYVFVRPGTESARRAAAHTFSLIGPLDGDLDLQAKAARHPLRMREELRRLDFGRLLFFGDFNRFGVAAFTAGDYELGIDIYRQGLERHPDNALLRYNLATVLLADGRTAEATRELERLVRRSGETEHGVKAAAKLEAIRRSQE